MRRWQTALPVRPKQSCPDKKCASRGRASLSERLDGQRDWFAPSPARCAWISSPEYAENERIIDRLHELGVQYAQGCGVELPRAFEDVLKALRARESQKNAALVREVQVERSSCASTVLAHQIVAPAQTLELLLRAVRRWKTTAG